MWETIKNDPILKTITIIILGVLGFGFAFNLMFGRSTMYSMDGGEMGGAMMGSSYSFGNTLSYLLFVAYKVFLIVLVIVLILALIKLADQYLLKGNKLTMENLKQDSMLKTLSIIGIAILAIGLLISIFGGMTGNGYYFHMNNSGMNSMMEDNYYMMGNGYGLGYATILLYLLKVLLFVSITGFIVGLAMYLFRNYSTANQKVIASSVCHICSQELKQEWKCCPNCGAEKEGAKIPEVKNTPAKADVSTPIETEVVKSNEKKK